MLLTSVQIHVTLTNGFSFGAVPGAVLGCLVHLKIACSGKKRDFFIVFQRRLTMPVYDSVEPRVFSSGPPRIVHIEQVRHEFERLPRRQLFTNGNISFTQALTALKNLNVIHTVVSTTRESSPSQTLWRCRIVLLSVPANVRIGFYEAVNTSKALALQSAGELALTGSTRYFPAVSINNESSGSRSFEFINSPGATHDGQAPSHSNVSDVVETNRNSEELTPPSTRSLSRDSSSFQDSPSSVYHSLYYEQYQLQPPGVQIPDIEEVPPSSNAAQSQVSDMSSGIESQALPVPDPIIESDHDDAQDNSTDSDVKQCVVCQSKKATFGMVHLSEESKSVLSCRTRYGAGFKVHAFSLHLCLCEECVDDFCSIYLCTYGAGTSYKCPICRVPSKLTRVF